MYTAVSKQPATFSLSFATTTTFFHLALAFRCCCGTAAITSTATIFHFVWEFWCCCTAVVTSTTTIFHLALGFWWCCCTTVVTICMWCTFDITCLFALAFWGWWEWWYLSAVTWCTFIINKIVMIYLSKCLIIWISYLALNIIDRPTQ